MAERLEGYAVLVVRVVANVQAGHEGVRQGAVEQHDLARNRPRGLHQHAGERRECGVGHHQQGFVWLDAKAVAYRGQCGALKSPHTDLPPAL